jgi:NAD(P)-dependent dehydrogenase (short-subunit alcohol dehydrogenase family)
VTANTISPGWVESDFGRSWMSHIAETAEGRSGEEFINDEKSNNPQKRMIQPYEIGNLAAFLCKEESMGINGQDMTVSGGSVW